MAGYDTTRLASSAEYLLGRATGEIQRKPETLASWARQVARCVFSGALDFHRAWDELWWAAILGGLQQLEAQEVIGESFAYARSERLVA